MQKLALWHKIWSFFWSYFLCNQLEFCLCCIQYLYMSIRLFVSPAFHISILTESLSVNYKSYWEHIKTSHYDYRLSISCRCANFSLYIFLIWFEATLLSINKSNIIFWWIELFVIMKCHSLFLVMLFSLKVWHHLFIIVTECIGLSFLWFYF